jgi:hypothetical protein
MNISKKEILKSPKRPWDKTDTLYDEIYIVPSGLKHDSGYMRIAIIGTYKDETNIKKYEICGYPDDISCHFPIKQLEHLTLQLVRMDCLYPSGILRYHTGNGKFKVSESLSSQDIYIV